MRWPCCPFLLKAVIVPLVLRRLLRGIGAIGGDPRWSDIAGSHSLGVASTVLLAIAVAAFGFFSVSALGIRSPVLRSRPCRSLWPSCSSPSC